MVVFCERLIAGVFFCYFFFFLMKIYIKKKKKRERERFTKECVDLEEIKRTV
jgi:phosphate/sulfate permease